jgi:FKBP12-rapamycin complex-associated protein
VRASLLILLCSRCAACACSDELIDVPYEENETKIIRFANYLRMVFQQSGDHSDHRLLKKASRAFGHLVRAGGTLAYEIVEFEVKRALEWLEVSQRSAQYR